MDDCAIVSIGMQRNITTATLTVRRRAASAPLAVLIVGFCASARDTLIGRAVIGSRRTCS